MAPLARAPRRSGTCRSTGARSCRPPPSPRRARHCRHLLLSLIGRPNYGRKARVPPLPCRPPAARAECGCRPPCSPHPAYRRIDAGTQAMDVRRRRGRGRRGPCASRYTTFHEANHLKASLDLDRWRTPTMVLVCAGLVLMLALGIRQSFGLFLRPMSMDLGWGRERVLLRHRVAEPRVGARDAVRRRDRRPPRRRPRDRRRGPALRLGLYAMAHATSPLLFDLSAGLLIGLGLSGTGFGVVLAVVARAFPPGAPLGRRGRGRAPPARSGSSRCCPRARA